MDERQVELRRLLVAASLFGFTVLMSMVARWTDEFWPLSVALIVIGISLGIRFRSPVVGTIVGVGLALLHVLTHESGNPVPFYLLALPWFGLVMALYFERLLVAVGFFVMCIAIALLSSPGL